MEHVWDDILTEDDRYLLENGCYGQPKGFGKKPMLMIVDLQPNYIGADKPIREQLADWPSGGGEKCWTGVRRILKLRDAAREAGVEIMYTRNVQYKTTKFDSMDSKAKRDKSRYIDGHPDADLLPEVQPLPNELVMDKSYPSAFYGTPLQSYLVKLGIDTLIIVGGSTSGCCYATAVDASTRNYNLIYVEDCLFDRITASHKTALLNVWMKYGDVLNSDAVYEYFKTLKK